MNGITQPVSYLTKHDIAAYPDTRTYGPGGKHAYCRTKRAFYGWALDEELSVYMPSR